MNNEENKKGDTVCFKGISNTQDLKKYLEKTCSVNTDKNLAECLGITTPTLSRMFSGKKGEYCSPHVSNAEKIVAFCAQQETLSIQSVRLKIYGLFYHPDDLERKIKCAEEENHSESNSGEETSSCNIPENQGVNESIETVDDCEMLCEQENEVQEKLLPKVEDMLEQIACLIKVNIKEYKRISIFEDGVLGEVIWENWAIFSGARLESIVGIHLTDKNYIQTMRRLSECDKCDDLFLLLYEDDNVFDRALRDDMYKFKNNVLLCCLTEKRTIWVKSFRKKEKDFLKDLFGKNNLIFPK